MEGTTTKPSLYIELSLKIVEDLIRFLRVRNTYESGDDGGSRDCQHDQ